MIRNDIYDLMQLTGKRILLMSPEPWEGLHMSKHHLSQALAAKGNHVYFVDPPKPGTTGTSIVAKGDVKVIRYNHWLRGINKMPVVVNRWYYRRLIDGWANLTGGPFDIIWNFDTSRMQAFPSGTEYKLLHLADYDILYIGKGLIPSADIVFTTCQVVADEVAPRTAARTVNVGHALDARWLEHMDGLAERPSRKPKRIVFMGQLAITYNDWEGFEEIASTHPNLLFDFIGPYKVDFPEPAFHRLRALPNVHMPGLKSKDELVPIVRAADLLFFGFRSASRAKERANPHKVLEYLSTGNPIVGSWTMEYAERQHLLTMAPEGASLNRAFNQALANYDELDAPERRRERIAFAKERSMPALITRIEQELPG